MTEFGVVRYKGFDCGRVVSSSVSPTDCYGPTNQHCVEYEVEGMSVCIGGTVPAELIEESVNIDKPVEKRRGCAKIFSPRKRILSHPGGWGFYRG